MSRRAIAPRISRRGDFVLIDLWAKLAAPQAVYYDVTWIGYCGEQIPDLIQNVFEIVKTARRGASDFAIQKARARQPFAGFEVDDVCREYITAQGYGENFFHRTGHSIGTEVHGTGANMDNLESHDERRVIANTCFSVEPGIYLAEFGVRSEVERVRVRRRCARHRRRAGRIDPNLAGPAGSKRGQ